MKKIMVVLFSVLFLMGLAGTAFAQSADEALRLYKKGQEANQYGRYQEALDYYERSLKILRSLNHAQGISANLNNIGGVYRSLGQYEKALSYYEESLKIRRELKIPQDIAISLNNIGAVYNSLGQYVKALLYYEEALKIVRDLDIPQYIATSLNNIGEVYGSLGQYEKALSYYDESLKIKRENNLSPQSIATSLNNIGFVYNSLGQYEKAISYYEESLKIRRQLNIPQDIAISLNNIGLVYQSLGQYEKAISYYEESLKIRRQLNIPQDIATSLNNIGAVYNSFGQYEKAISYYEESLKIRRQLNIPQDIATSLNNIGIVYLSQKRYKEAEESFLETKSKPRLVDVYIATKRHDEALKLLKEMTPRWNADDPYRIQFYTQHGFALKGSKDFKEASHEFLKAVSISEEMRQKVKEKTGFFAGGSAGGRIRTYKGLISTLSERAIKGDDNPLTPFNKGDVFNPYGKDLSSAAFYFSESTKARTLLEAMTESARKYTKTEILSELRKKEEGILNQLSAIENIWEDTYKKGEEGFKELVKRKEGLKKELDSLISKIRKEYPMYASLNYPKPIPPEELPLKDNEVLLEYAVGDDATYLFRVSKGRVERVIKIPGGKEEMERLVNEFILPLKDSNTRDKFSPASGNKLYSLLLNEALKDLSPDKNVIIVPDGILGMLPFEALVITAGKDLKDTVFVSDRWKISYYQSATVMALNRTLKPSGAKRAVFALGDPIFDKKDPRYIAYLKKEKPVLLAQNLSQYSLRQRGIKIVGIGGEDDRDIVFVPLPETRQEVLTIAKLFNTTPQAPDVLLAVDANETQVKKTTLSAYRYLHFATHGFLSSNLQGIKEPVLVLSQVENKEGDDGMLSLTEVLGLKLDADMVVLSACVTGAGKVMEGEGVANFARAFQYAGARSVVVSLWEVASKETVEYMESLYRYLKAGKSRGEALRLARKDIKSKYPNPFFWAPFILHGEG